jgi:hypothetical protein
MNMSKPNLFGINHSNRDFTLRDTWGKNQFNSSFPASLCAYLSEKGLDNIYLTLDKNMKIKHKTLSTTAFFGINPLSDNLFYAFESAFSPYQQLVIGNMPRVDLVTQERDSGLSLKPIEIKLTALPDNTTCDLSEHQYGTELVIRPDTIVYLACSIAIYYKNKLPDLQKVFGSSFDAIKDWTDAENVLPYVSKIIAVLDTISLELIDNQEPIVMQPIWKTEGKSPRLAENCLDVFSGVI